MTYAYVFADELTEWEQLVKDFDPDQHPRDDAGRFAAGGGGSVAVAAPVKAALADYVLSGEEAGAVRAAVEAHDATGERLPHNAQVLVDAIADAPKTTEPIYRGIGVPGTMSEVAQSFAVGTDIHVPFGSFSQAQNQAEKFAQWETDAAQGSGETVPVEVTFKVDAGAQGLVVPYEHVLPNYDPNDDYFSREREVLVRGDFTVSNVSTYQAAGFYEELPAHPALMVTLEPK